MAFIEELGLTYTLPGKQLLSKDVEFKVASGQRVALIGANGVGKSTLLRIIASEDNEYVGTARVEGTLLYVRLGGSARTGSRGVCGYGRGRLT
jgi:ATPase subunit of ABC transporter with duplicated ATPase domains